MSLGGRLDFGYFYASKTSEVEKNKLKKVTVEGLDILIVNFEDNFYAIDALCSHYGGDHSEGTLQGNILTCPVHGAKFDVTNGHVVSAPTEPLDRPNIENLTSYPLKIENQDIYIKIG
jgi:3-phenylpropionate/trans-cinnamate dioxygenase ferredoxin subunit